MEMKLLNEMRGNSSSSMPTYSPTPIETNVRSSAPTKSSGSSPTYNGHPSNNESTSSPAAMLVTELFETIKAKSNTPSNNRIPTPEKMVELSTALDEKHHEIDFKANLRKVKKPNNGEDSDKKNISSTPKHIDFKSQLKKTESTYANPEPSKPLLSSATKKESVDVREADKSSGEKVSRALKDEKTDTNPIIDFKAKLRKSTSKPEQPLAIHDSFENDDPPHNFQARLRKVSGTSKTNVSNDQQGNSLSSDVKKQTNGIEKLSCDSPRSSAKNSLKRDSVDSIDSGGAGSETNEDKRKSTGSITSLRKMWESGKDSNSKGVPPISKSPMNDEASLVSSIQQQKQEVHDNINSPISHTTVKFEKRIWPPVPNTETEKPMVPVKPTVKPTPAPPTTKPPPPKEPAPTSCRSLGKPSPPKPPMAAKPNVCNIYAAPTIVTSRRGKPHTATDGVDTGSSPFVSQSSNPTNVPVTSSIQSTTASHDTHSGGSGCSSSSTSEKEGIEGNVNRGALLVNCHNLSDMLDSTSSKLITEEKLSKTNVIQLSDQVSDVYAAALVYVDNIPATGRFRYRSLCNKLEEQSKELRELSIGNNKMERSNFGGSSMNSSNYNGVVHDIQNTVKGLVNVIQR
jgi:hypothetical protein